jgi:ribonuclease J
LPGFLEEDEYGFIPRNKVVVILTGSQGEPRAALAKLSRDEMRHVALASGDTVVFSSRTIPGNEKGILEIKNGADRSAA